VKRWSIRFVIFSALITTALSLTIGGFASVSLKNSQIETVDAHLTLIADQVISNPSAPISTALDAVSREDFNLTIGLLSGTGEFIVINRSQLLFEIAPSDKVLKSARNSVVTIDGSQQYRLLTLEISGGDLLVLANSLEEINQTFTRNINRLLILTVLVDLIAILLTSLLLLRNNRKLQDDSLLRMQKFLADASHELRTPLTVIKGYSEMLSKNQIKEKTDQQRAFSRVNSEIIRMENLIHDLLLLAELGETTDPSQESVDLTSLVRGYLSDFRVLHPDRAVVEEIDEDVFLAGSIDHLRRLLQNILNNISRHTPVDAPVKVALRREAKKIMLSVEDGGPGLPESAYQEGSHLLNRFNPRRSSKQGGSGLGLSIIAAIVSEHGGRLQLRRSDLGGLAVVVEI
jgi:signal transduction histidine kinase